MSAGSGEVRSSSMASQDAECACGATSATVTEPVTWVRFESRWGRSS
jgi:hypothetical protein